MTLTIKIEIDTVQPIPTSVRNELIHALEAQLEGLEDDHGIQYSYVLTANPQEAM